MSHKDTRDIAGGVLMMGIGVYAAWHANSHYALGELSRMGPGYLPMVLGFVLALLGLLILVPALFRPGSPVRVEWRSLVLIIGSLIAFAFLVETTGLIAATLAAVLLSSLADRQMSWRNRILVALGVTLLTWVIFIVGLGMTLPVWPWNG
ncbi:tripartite tricarboxylate transporter TctB family protein [Rhodocyclaceae bacterium SMB388]